MEKILTVSIAAYNVEKFIRKTLESCVIPEIMDELEVLVIDDGATDSIAEIAGEFVGRYPQTFSFLHKENGGYGTTVNVGIQAAKGKYFRLLDGDDWFDRNGLKGLIEILRTSSVDAVFTKMYHEYPDREVLVEDCWKEYEGQKINLSNLKNDVSAGMWEFTIKTEILKQYSFELPGKTLYTDHLFLMYPIPYIKEVLFLNIPLYCYRLGYEEQSISTSSRIKHVGDIMKVSEIICRYYHDKCRQTRNWKYALERARFCYMEAFRTLLLLPFNYENYCRIRNFDEKLSSVDSDIYAASVNQKGGKALRCIRKARYLGYLMVKGKYHIRKKYRSLRSKPTGSN